MYHHPFLLRIYLHMAGSQHARPSSLFTVLAGKQIDCILYSICLGN